MKSYDKKGKFLSLISGGIGVRHPPKTYANFFCSLVISIVYSDSVRAEGGQIPYWSLIK